MTLKRPLLVTGGAGYVGSHAVLAFQEAGWPVVVLDDLSTGLRSAVPAGTAFVEGDAGDAATTGAVISEHGVGAVVHLAGSVVVPESVADPSRLRATLQWSPRFDDLGFIVRSALAWERRREPRG